MKAKVRPTDGDIKLFDKAFNSGFNDGLISEAQESLTKRFTENELRAFVLWAWQSPMMDSIRKRISIIEKKLDDYEIHKGKKR